MGKIRDFFGNKTTTFILFNAIYVCLYIFLVTGMRLEMAALTMINSLIAGIITFLSIVKAIDNKIDSRYFQFRKSIDGNIIDEMKKFWDGKCDNTSTSTNCPSNVNGACVKNINKEKLFMKMFYRIIDNNQRFDTSKELMFVYFNYYWVLMIILFLSFTYIPFTLVTFFIQSYILPNLLDGYMRLWCFVCIIFVILVPLVLPLARKKQILRYIFIISYLASLIVFSIYILISRQDNSINVTIAVFFFSIFLLMPITARNEVTAKIIHTQEGQLTEIRVLSSKVDFTEDLKTYRIASVCN